MQKFSTLNLLIVFLFLAEAFVATRTYGAENLKDDKNLAASNAPLRLRKIALFRRAPGKIGPPEVTGVGWSPDGTMLAGYSAYGTLVTIWDTSTGNQLKALNVLGRPHYVDSLFFLRNGHQLVTPITLNSREDNQYSLSLWNVDSGTVDKNIAGPFAGPSMENQPGALALSPDGKRIAMSLTSGGRPVTVYSTQDWSIEQSIQIDRPKRPDTAIALAFSSDGKTLAIGRISGQISFHTVSDPNTDPAFVDIYTPLRAVNVGAVAYSPDGQFLATGALFGHTILAEQEHAPIKIWRVADNSLVKVYAGEAVTVHQLAWSPDGRYLAAAMDDRAVRIYSPDKADEPIAVQKFGSEIVYSVSFSPDGHKLAVGAGDGASIFQLEH
ncbi:MAG TPA: hypothetical protein VH079_17115 [Terriglobales bacterium]|nr:hypothetical protein [Terriglobales bacterium]